MKISGAELFAYCVAFISFVAPFWIIRDSLNDPGAAFFVPLIFLFLFLPFWIITYAGLRAARGEADKRRGVKKPRREKKTNKKSYKSGRIYWR